MKLWPYIIVLESELGFPTQVKLKDFARNKRILFMFPKAPAVYKLINKATDEFYIGSTNNLYIRINHHRSKLERGVHENIRLQNTYRGWDSVIVEYRLADSRDHAFQLEQQLLDKYCGRKLCLNIYNQAGGCFKTGTMPLKFRRLRTELNFKRQSPGDHHIRRTKEVHTGKVVGSETRQKLSEALKGRGSEDTKPKAVIINGVYYPSIKAAATALGIPHPTVRNRVLSKNPLMDGWVWA